ncbi:hypothetical protein N431DRAFT_436663 [Stipitochalara longipes BDJ]|nr:hypothetical protein N431DRAFT_436663 [Stipitochalara longipes BDJ]
MAPILDFSSRVLARISPEGASDSSSLNSPDNFLGPSTPDTTSTINKSAVKLSTGASVAIAVVFVVLMLSITLTICVCVRSSKRKDREDKESKEVEMGNTFGDEDSTMGIVKGETKKPERIWAPWRR